MYGFMDDQNYENRVTDLEREIDFLRSENNRLMAENAKARKRLMVISIVYLLIFLGCLGSVIFMAGKLKTSKESELIVTADSDKESNSNEDTIIGNGFPNGEESDQTSDDSINDTASDEDYELKVTEVTEGVPDSSQYDVFRVELTKYNFYDYFEPINFNPPRPQVWPNNPNNVNALMIKSKICDDGWYLLYENDRGNETIGDIGYVSEFSYGVTIDHRFMGTVENESWSTQNSLFMVYTIDDDFSYDMDTFDLSYAGGTLYFVSERIIDEVSFGYINDEYRDEVGTDLENNTKWGRTIVFKKDYSILENGERCNYMVQGDVFFTASDIQW